MSDADDFPIEDDDELIIEEEEEGAELPEIPIREDPRFIKVLVVDDILYVVKSIGRILTTEGFFVITARSGREALEAYLKYAPDLMTVDQKLPDMTGMQLVRSIRSLKNSELTKIIFVSAVHDKEEIRTILQQKVDGYIMKPFKKAKLIETVRRLLDLPPRPEEE